MGDVQVSKQPSDIVGRGLDRERPIAVGRAAVPLLLERNHSAGAGEKREYEAKGRIDRRSPAVKQHEGYPVMVAMHSW